MGDERFAPQTQTTCLAHQNQAKTFNVNYQ